MKFSVDRNMKAFPRVRTRLNALMLTEADFRGPILTRLGQVHREQVKTTFATEGAAGIQGSWPKLSAEYAKRKRGALRLAQRRRRKTGAVRRGRSKGPISQKILVWSGDMKDRFVSPSRSQYIQQVVSSGKGVGIFQFGAASTLASYHRKGGTSTHKSRPAKSFFRSPKTYRVVLPRRDMVTKSKAQILEMRREFVRWYTHERIPQALGVASSMRKPRPSAFFGEGLA